MSKRTTFLLFSVLFISTAMAQEDTIRISLEQVIDESKLHSIDALIVKNQFQSAYWEYRTFKAELLPEVIFDGTIPYYSKSYNKFQQTDGTFNFVSNDYSRMNAAISINQNIPWTGGKLSVESSLERLDQYGENAMTNYLGIPAAITLEQPIVGFNRVKWMQKIEPVKYKVAKMQYAASMEEVNIKAIVYFFNLLLGKMNYEIALQNQRNTEKLYAVSEAKRKIGQISENDLLQLKITSLKAEAYVTNAASELKAAMFGLRSFLGYGDNVALDPFVPESFPIDRLEFTQVLEFTKQNSPFIHDIQRKNLEANRDVNFAKSERWNANLFASFGLSGQEDRVPEIFNNLRSNQIVNIGVRIPILDWGKGKGKVKVAESNRGIVQSQAEKDMIDFSQNIFLQVEKLNNQSKQLSIAKETDNVAQKRYNASIEAFMLGRIDVLNLNDAQVSKDEARRKYIEEMCSLWTYYYQLRSVTLYDFEKNKAIVYDL